MMPKRITTRTVVLTLLCCIGLAGAADGPYDDYLAPYQDRDAATLGQMMATPLPTERLAVARSLAMTGAAGYPVIAAGLVADDWTVRRCALDALAALLMTHRHKGRITHQPLAAPAHLLTEMPTLQPLLLACLADEQAWVRQGAAQVLEELGPVATDWAAEPLITACGDTDVWVREAAMQALAQVAKASPALLVRGAVRVLEQPSTGFSDKRHAMPILTTHGQEHAELVVPALIRFIEHHGEGMWGGCVFQAMDLLVDLAPEHPRVIPLISGVMLEHARWSADSAQALGRLGPRAESALPAMRQAITLVQADGGEQTAQRLHAIEQAMNAISGETDTPEPAAPTAPRLP